MHFSEHAGSPDARFRAIFGVCGSIGVIGHELDVVRENLQRIEKDISKETMKKETHICCLGQHKVVKKKKVSFLYMLKLLNCTISC